MIEGKVTAQQIMTEPTQAEVPHEHIWLMRIFITFGMTMMVLPCIFFWWIYIGRADLFRFILPIYPGARQISEAYAYYAADSGQKLFYYWTPDSTEQISNYYTRRNLGPFIPDRDGTLATVFNIDGSHLEYGGPFPQYACSYRQIYECIIIEMIDLNQNKIAELPYPPSGSSNINATPFLTSPLQGGTLIMYSYYIDDF